MNLSPQPVGLPGLVVLTVGGVAFITALLAARRRRGPPDPGQGRRSRRSWLGIAVQAAGFVAVGVGPFRIVRDPLWPLGLAEATLIAVLIGAAIWLFVASTRVMGAAWSLEARTRSDHQLATAGPFAHVRHPIYLGMGLFLIALTVAYGHETGLLVAIPLFALGTWLRIRDEEALLLAKFGPAYVDYAKRVKRFVPGVF